MTFRRRSTKIVATLGPVSDSRDAVSLLLQAGVDVFRLNASHGTSEERSALISVIRGTAAELGMRPGILLDLQGPKIRLGKFAGGQAFLVADDQVGHARAEQQHGRGQPDAHRGEDHIDLAEE